MAKNCLESISNALFIPSIIIAIALHLIDIGSDIFLAYRYYHDKDFWWCGLTVTFIVIPWFYSMYSAKMESGFSIMLHAATLNLLPVTWLIEAE